MVVSHARGGALGKILYGGLFTMVWPAALALWSMALDASGLLAWGVPLPPWSGALPALAGAGLMVVAMRALVTEGGGLPMNAYPTTRRVSGSVYALLAHPIYVGFTLAVAGAAVMLGSPAGFWLAMPLSALASCALVVGYEGPALRARLGEAGRRPWLSLPQADEAMSTPRRAFAGLLPLAAWAGLYTLFSAMPEPSGAVPLGSWETGFRPDWAVWAYSLAYPFVVLAPFAASSAEAARRLAVSAWLAIGFGFAAMILLPARHPFPEVAYGGLTGLLMEANRAVDAAWLACPSFHVAWTALASFSLGLRWPRLRALWFAVTLTVAAACLLTDAHAPLDIAAGWLLAWLCWHHRRVWGHLAAATERLGNSLSSVRFGPVRVLSHAGWSFSGAAAGMGLAAFLAGPGETPFLFGIALIGILGGGVWGFWLEGGGRLSRPFGYFGFLIAASGALLLVFVLDRERGGLLMAAFAAAAPLAQAIGRARCAVQGCCHGHPVSRAIGIRIHHPESRVTRLSAFAGRPIHPTPLYSGAANLLMLPVLLRLWQVGASGPQVAGCYLVLSSLARFAEERFRGEPQTPVRGGLTVYQWLSVGAFLGGLALSAIPGTPLAPAGLISAGGVVGALVLGAVAALAMSVDWPESGLLLSRLTVAPPGRERPTPSEPPRLTPRPPLVNEPATPSPPSDSLR